MSHGAVPLLCSFFFLHVVPEADDEHHDDADGKTERETRVSGIRELVVVQQQEPEQERDVLRTESRNPASRGRFSSPILSFRLLSEGNYTSSKALLVTIVITQEDLLLEMLSGSFILRDKCC